MASFSTPTVHVNQVGWGPTDLPERYLLLPFNPFSKSEKLGRVPDFTAKPSGYQGRRFREDQGPVVNPEEVFKQVEDPNKKIKAIGLGGRGGFRGRFQRGSFRGRGGAFSQRNEAEEEQKIKGKQAKYLMQNSRRGKQFRGRGGDRGGPGFRRQWNRRDLPTLEASVTVEASWKKVQEFELSQLNKLSMQPPTAKDLKWCGELFKYDDSYERVTARTPQRLERYPKTVFNSSTSIDDPVIQQYAQEMSGKGRVVLATDELLAHLMASPRSILPWDVYFTRFENGLMFIDKRDDSNLEMLTVDETAGARQQKDKEDKPIPVPPCDSPDKLAIEATAINQNFSQQALDRSEKKKVFEHPNPLWDEEDKEEGTEPASFAYRYRQWQLSDDLTLIARTELHAYQRVLQPKKKSMYMTMYALNEANPRLSGAPAWRTKIDTSRGSIVANALKNNSCKLAKWTAQTLLAGADQMKLGFVSRKTVRDPLNHEILGTLFYNPTDFANQINLPLTNAWGIIKSIVELIYKQAPGKYVLMREPNKAMLTLYEVPMSSFTEDAEVDDDGQGEFDEEGEFQDEEE